MATHEQLSEAFDLVRDMDDWRKPINKTINVDDSMLPLIEEAIIYFTGTVPELTTTLDGLILVLAIGYRNGPCGP